MLNFANISQNWLRVTGVGVRKQVLHLHQPVSLRLWRLESTLVGEQAEQPPSRPLLPLRLFLLLHLLQVPKGVSKLDPHSLNLFGTHVFAHIQIPFQRVFYVKRRVVSLGYFSAGHQRHAMGAEVEGRVEVKEPRQKLLKTGLVFGHGQVGQVAQKSAVYALGRDSCVIRT